MTEKSPCFCRESVVPKIVDMNITKFICVACGGDQGENQDEVGLEVLSSCCNCNCEKFKEISV